MYPAPPRGVFALFCKPTDLSPDSWEKINFTKVGPPFFIVVPKKKKILEKNS
jgi:hypothetical protein